MASRTLHVDLEVRTRHDPVAQPVVDEWRRPNAASGRFTDAGTARPGGGRCAAARA